MAGWNLQIDYKHAVLARMMQSFGLAFLFIPINVSAFFVRAERKNEHGNRNHQPGAKYRASVGIATVTTLLQRRTQFHQSQLMERVNGLNLAYHKHDFRYPGEIYCWRAQALITPHRRPLEWFTTLCSAKRR